MYHQRLLRTSKNTSRQRLKYWQTICQSSNFQQIDTDIKTGCHSKDSLLQFEKQILAAKSLLDATSNKRIEPQLRFFSTKKKREHTNHLRFTKPSDDDIKKTFGTKGPKDEFIPKVKVACTQKGKVCQKQSGLRYKITGFKNYQRKTIKFTF